MLCCYVTSLNCLDYISQCLEHWTGGGLVFQSCETLWCQPKVDPTIIVFVSLKFCSQHCKELQANLQKELLAGFPFQELYRWAVGENAAQF